MTKANEMMKANELLFITGYNDSVTINQVSPLCGTTTISGSCATGNNMVALISNCSMVSSRGGQKRLKRS